MNDDAKDDETGTPAPKVDIVLYVLFAAFCGLIGYGFAALFDWIT